MPTRSPLKKHILQQAIAVAMASDAPKKMGAILLDKRNRVIASGTNSYEITHTQQFYAAVMAANKYKQSSLKQKQYLHAELSCILRSRKPGNKLVITYITKKCPTIKEIHWSTNDQEFVYVKI